MNVVGIGKALNYLVKGAEVVGAVGTFYELFDKPRKDREELREIRERVDERVELYMAQKMDKLIDQKIDKRMQEIYMPAIKACMEESLSSNLEAVVASSMMRAGVKEATKEKEAEAKTAEAKEAKEAKTAKK